MTQYLLDTHIILWLAGKPEKLSQEVKDILVDYDNIIYFSVVNLWEIAIKTKQSKQEFNVDIKKLYQQLLLHNFVELNVTCQHVLQLEELPLHHKDPFDRLLIAQAIKENICLISEDKMMARYYGLQLQRN